MLIFLRWAVVWWAGLSLAALACGRPQSNSCVVTTSLGAVRGADLGVSCAFRRIPYAAPPLGELRWKAPQAALPWAHLELDGTVPAPMCPMVDPPGTANTIGNEDCLTLDIWGPHPRRQSRVPVLVWLDGEDFSSSSAHLATEHFRRISEDFGILVIAPNYRVGPFGFLGHRALSTEHGSHPSSANYGLLDQRLALRWVRDHIADFGGDPARITVAGRVAGGDSVGFHLVSPNSAGLFSRAILQGRFASSKSPTLADAESVGERFAAALGCNDRTSVLHCLRSKTMEQVLMALPSGRPQFTETMRVAWGPVVDGFEVPDQPRSLFERNAFAAVPVMIGTAGDEGWNLVDRSFPAGLSADVYRAEVEAEFGSSATPTILEHYPSTGDGPPKATLARLVGDVEAVCEARRVTRLIARSKAPVFLYSLGWGPSAGELSAPSRISRDLFLASSGAAGRAPYESGRHHDTFLSGRFAAYWTRFVVSGSPDTAEHGDVEWPAFSDLEPAAARHLPSSWPIRSYDGPRTRKVCDFWESFFLRSVGGTIRAAQH
jgi:para-nitrobenzyl esterase